LEGQFLPDFVIISTHKGWASSVLGCQIYRSQLSPYPHVLSLLGDKSIGYSRCAEEPQSCIPSFLTSLPYWIDVPACL
jgi:hypothetical protein